MPLRFYAVFASLLLAVSASAAPYKGVGGQIEAYGTVAATFHTGQKAAEMCGKYPALKAESQETAQKFLTTNKPIFDRVSLRLWELAEENGGEVERRRLKAEIDTAFQELRKQATQEVSKIATSARACSEMLSNLRRGYWDLQVKDSREIELIMGSHDQARSPSFIKGILDGCVDGQKQLLSHQGLSYQENKEHIRQYCHCMTPFTADLASTAEGRAKLMDGDPKIKARVKKMEAICLDGLKNGRSFAP